MTKRLTAVQIIRSQANPDIHYLRIGPIEDNEDMRQVETFALSFSDLALLLKETIAAMKVSNTAGAGT